MLLTRGDDGAETGEPRVVSAGQLAEFASEVDHPVYWLGEREGAEYEFEETAVGAVRIRYLDDGDGSDEGAVVAVATYPAENGVAVIKRVARETDGAELGRSSDGAFLLIDPTSANNVRLAYPGDDVSIEVFSPEPGEALLKAANGEVEPVS